MSEMENIYLLVPLMPLAGAIIAGFLGYLIGPAWTHRTTIALMFVCVIASSLVFIDVLQGNLYNGAVYTWMTSGDTLLRLGL